MNFLGYAIVLSSQVLSYSHSLSSNFVYTFCSFYFSAISWIAFEECLQDIDAFDARDSRYSLKVLSIGVDHTTFHCFSKCFFFSFNVFQEDLP